MIYSTLDSSRQDESNDSKIIPIGAIFAEIAIFAKFHVGSSQVNCLTRPEFSGRVGSGTRISGQKCGALHNASRKKPKLLSTDNNLNKILLTKPMAKDPKLQTQTPKIKLRHKMMTSMTSTCKIPLMVLLWLQNLPNLLPSLLQITFLVNSTLPNARL